MTVGETGIGIGPAPVTLPTPIHPLVGQELASPVLPDPIGIHGHRRRCRIRIPPLRDILTGKPSCIG
jgi:hypothetical protein